MTKISPRRLADLVRSNFWLVPALCAAASVGAALGLVAVDKAIGDFRSNFLFPGPPEGARGILGAITTAMISFTGLVFSITVVVLVLVSGQFSPRVLRGFLRDRFIQWTLGVFVATFVYAITVSREVLGTDGRDAFVPRIAVTFAFVLMLASVGLFIGYIDHVANSIRISTIIERIGAESRALLERRHPVDAPPEPARALPVADGTEVSAKRPGAIVSVHEARIVQYACEHDLLVELTERVGDFVPEGGPLLRVAGGDARIAETLAGFVTQDHERTMEQDLAFGFRQLVDIAEKALSPGINDPTTASQVLDVVHDLLRRLATRNPTTGRFADADGAVRLVVPQYAFADFLDAAVAEIWHYGRAGAQIPERLERLLRDLDTVALPAYRPAIREWLDRVGGDLDG